MVCKKSAMVEPPSRSQKEIILKDINETDEDKLKHNERLILEWLKCENHLPNELDNGFLRGMLRSNKHILERTKQKLEQHLAAKQMYPDILMNRSPFSKDIAQTMDVVNIAVLPKLTQKGNAIWMFGLHRFDAAEFNIQSVVKLFLMMYELFMSSDNLYTGEVAIFDASHFSATHITKWFGPFFKTMMILLREAYSIRIKQLHIINAPTMLNKMVTATNYLLHSKVRNSLYVHDSHGNLAEMFGEDYLPADFGGNLKTLREFSTEWYEILNDNAKWFESQENIKMTGIPKRVHSKLHIQDQLGMEGSFRKLEID